MEKAEPVDEMIRAAIERFCKAKDNRDVTNEFQHLHIGSESKKLRNRKDGFNARVHGYHNRKRGFCSRDGNYRYVSEVPQPRTNQQAISDDDLIKMMDEAMYPLLLNQDRQG